MKTQTVPAYAKLNLTLDILGKRLDGYHELRMVMQTVSLCDDVTVTLTDGTGVACRVAGAELPCDERNLAVKAANAFCEALGYHGGIDITLTKRIPSEAGMAGGSADEGAVSDLRGREREADEADSDCGWHGRRQRRRCRRAGGPE